MKICPNCKTEWPENATYCICGGLLVKQIKVESKKQKDMPFDLPEGFDEIFGNFRK